MWRWYRSCEVCYTYLNDVKSDLDPVGLSEALRSSKWFTRGWTLQELLAPSTLILYDEQWEPNGTKSNMAAESSTITGIDQDYLCDADALAGASVAEKMSWAADRQTKRVEDLAYSLIGIFDINMPLLYGERERAFTRLQHEIIKQTDDQSIFAWNPHAWKIHDQDSVEEIDWAATKLDNAGEYLASAPIAFKGCGNIVRTMKSSLIQPYVMTNRGLQIRLPLFERRGQLWAGLQCRRNYDYWSDLAIPLEPLEHGHRYARARGELELIRIDDMRGTGWHDVLLTKATTTRESKHDPVNDALHVSRLSLGYKVRNITSMNTAAQKALSKEQIVALVPGKAHIIGVIKIVPDMQRKQRKIPVDVDIVVYRKRSTFLGLQGLHAYPVPSEDVEKYKKGVFLGHDGSIKSIDLSSRPKLDISLIHIRVSERHVRNRNIIFTDIRICSTRNEVGWLKLQEQIAVLSRIVPPSLEPKLLLAVEVGPVLISGYMAYSVPCALVFKLFRTLGLNLHPVVSYAVEACAMMLTAHWMVRSRWIPFFAPGSHFRK